MFYDLNLDVNGVGDHTRRETVAMAMQLGYSGVAANHVFTGVMADSDRCRLRPLELQTILAAVPGVADAARFHRELLHVSPELPFRQFTRITVVVDNPGQAAALNSGNPVLKTYDLVAVRPTNQKCFNQACSQLEVDIISLDLCQRLPFRLKMPIVKAAMERGVHFELSYARTIHDPKARRELFANAEMLRTAARGRNIILSSGATRAMELRGPNDVANLSTLFGLPLENAKACVSRNCKEVIMHGIMRKATYKGAIHIAEVGSTENAVDPENLFNVPTEWDPLSLSGASADFIPVESTRGAISDLTSSGLRLLESQRRGPVDTSRTGPDSRPAVSSLPGESVGGKVVSKVVAADEPRFFPNVTRDNVGHTLEKPSKTENQQDLKAKKKKNVELEVKKTVVMKKSKKKKKRKK